MNLFGMKKKAPTAPSQPPVASINELRDQLVILEKRENLMDQRITACIQEAIRKKNSKDQKGIMIIFNDTKWSVHMFVNVGALFQLKRKKMFEAEVLKLQGARITLDSQIMALESASINIATVQAMKKGADAMKQIHGNL